MQDDAGHLLPLRRWLEDAGHPLCLLRGLLARLGPGAPGKPREQVTGVTRNMGRNGWCGQSPVPGEDRL